MTKKTTRTRAEAKKLMWEYYSTNKATLPRWVRQFREDVILKLTIGLSAKSVFDELCELNVSDQV